MTLLRFEPKGLAFFPASPTFLVGASLVALFACGPEAEIPGTVTTVSSDQPPDGVELEVDWEDPSHVLELEGGWAVHACEGDALLLCVEHAGQTVGVIEAISYPIDSFQDLDLNEEPRENLGLFASGFVEAIGSNRAVGCGADYGFRPLPVKDFVLGGTPGISFGFEGTMPDGSPSELNLQYATIIGNQVITIVAIAYDEGGCPGRDDLSGFDSATLTDFRPLLEAVLRQSPLPDMS